MEDKDKENKKEGSDIQRQSEDTKKKLAAQHQQEEEQTSKKKQKKETDIEDVKRELMGLILELDVENLSLDDIPTPTQKGPMHTLLMETYQEKLKEDDMKYRPYAVVRKRLLMIDGTPQEGIEITVRNSRKFKKLIKKLAENGLFKKDKTKTWVYTGKSDPESISKLLNILHYYVPNVYTDKPSFDFLAEHISENIAVPGPYKESPVAANIETNSDLGELPSEGEDNQSDQDNAVEDVESMGFNSDSLDKTPETGDIVATVPKNVVVDKAEKQKQLEQDISKIQDWSVKQLTAIKGLTDTGKLRLAAKFGELYHENKTLKATIEKITRGMSKVYEDLKETDLNLSEINATVNTDMAKIHTQELGIELEDEEPEIDI